MLQLVSIHVDYIPLNQDDTFCMIVEDSMDIGIWEEIP